MVEPDETDPYGVVPDGFCEAWGAESIPEALRIAERSPGTTPNYEKDRCPVPSCRTTRLRLKPGYQDMPHKVDTKYKCSNGHHVADPRPPLAECPVEHALKWLDEQQTHREKWLETMPINTEFSWLADSDLKDPDERESILPFAGLDDDALAEAAIRLYRPWADGGPSYRDLAPLFPYSRKWVGDQIRAWKDGDRRDLVPEPGPSAEAAADDTAAVATDGGRPSRWAAYGSD